MQFLVASVITGLEMSQLLEEFRSVANISYSLVCFYVYYLCILMS